MPAGMSKAKARQNSRTKARASRAKANLPAKAGKRRPHNIKHDASGNYIAADMKPRPKLDIKPSVGYTMPDRPNERVNKPTGAVLREGMNRIRSMERNTKGNSDPFAFMRMKTHFQNGIFDLQKDHK